MTKVKIAVVQFGVRNVSDVENISKAEEFIKKAASKKAQIVVFPEDFVTRTTPENVEFVDLKKYLGKFQEFAKKYEVDVVPGSFIKKEGKKFFNTSYYIDHKGKILAKYNKIHLWISERSSMKPGRTVRVFETRFGKVGLAICWDLASPEVFRRLAKKGAKIVFCPSYWCYQDAGIGMRYDKKAEAKLVDSLCADRAFEDDLIVVFCNSAERNHKDGETPVGHSQIAVPFRGTLRKMNHTREAMFIQEVDTSILRDAERVYKTREDVKNDGRVVKKK